MRNVWFIGAITASLLIADQSAYGQRRRGNSNIAAQNGWILSLAEGKALAKKTGQPIMLEFRCEP